MFSYQRSFFRAVCALALVCLLAAALPMHSASAQSAIPRWTRNSVQHNGIVYLLFSDPNIIRRYDLSSETWLADIPFPFSLDLYPTLTVDDEYIFVTREKANYTQTDLFRINLDGSNPILLSTLPVGNIFPAPKSAGGFLFVGTPSYYDQSGSSFALLSVNRQTGAVISVTKKGVEALAIAPNQHKVFGFIDNGELLAQINYDPVSGAFVGDWTSPYTWGEVPYYPPDITITPDENYIITETGWVLNTSDLSYRTSLGVAGGSQAFYGNLPIVWDYSKLIFYDANFRQAGWHAVPDTGYRIFAHGEEVFYLVFVDGAPGFEKIPFSQFQPMPDAAVDPRGLQYTVDQVLLGGEVLYLLSRENQSIFRWDVAARRYLDSIPLAGAPAYMAYSAVDQRLYLAYSSGQVRQIRLGVSDAELPFIQLFYPPCGLETAGGLVIACEDYHFNVHSTGNPYGYHSVYNADGARLDRKWRNGMSGVFTWIAALGRLFYAQNFGASLWSEAIAPDGTLSGEQGSILSCHYNRCLLDSNADGSLGLLSTGVIANLSAMTAAHTLPTPPKDGVWIGETLYTFTPSGADSLLHKLDAAYAQAAARDIPGEPLALFATADGLLAVNSLDGKPRFTLWDAGDLSPVADPPVAAFTYSAGFTPAGVPVTLTNLSTGTFDSVTWDFGDGASSTEDSPTHLYPTGGEYTLNLTVSGPGGEDTLSLPLPLFYRLSLPAVLKPLPGKAGVYPANLCAQFNLMKGWTLQGVATECVAGITVNADGTLRLDFTWQVDYQPGASCWTKQSDAGNSRMYIRDNTGYLVQMIGSGGSAGQINCVEEGLVYNGWFLYPPTRGRTITFYDMDVYRSFGPVTLPAP